MKVAFTSEVVATYPTSTLCNNPGTEFASITSVNHVFFMFYISKTNTTTSVWLEIKLVNTAASPGMFVRIA
jgi:hypothetical protein